MRVGSVKRIGAAVALVACVVWLAGPASADVDQKFSIDDVTIGEGGVTATFTISLTAGTDPTASVDWATANGSATAGDDYTSSSGSETVDAGSSKTVTVPILQDSVDEENEIFTVTLSNANGATIDDGSGAGTITDDDTSPSLAISGPATRDEAAGTATYNVAVSGTSASTVSVNYSAAGGTATAGADFSLTPGTLTWNPGDTATKQITVNITNDTLDEDDETYSVNLSSPSGATISTGTANTTITDNDSQPTTGAFASVSTAEGQSGTHELNFTVNLSAASGKAVTINYSTVAGTASAGSDYVAEVNQNITIPAGQTTGTIGIAINGDTVPEPDESFTVNLNNATNATLGADTQATGTITNDDSGVTASINDVTQAEGNGPGTTSFTFTIALSGPAPTASTITWRTADGSATQGSDYNAVGNTTITIAQNATSATVSVSVIGDTAPEPNETFFVDLVGSSGSVSLSADNRGIGTITNDDSGVTASINDVTLAEGNGPGTTSFTFTVSLSAPAPAPITITYRTEDGTANAASGDYTAHPNTPLSFATGAQTRTVTVVVNGDVVAEANETFFVDLVGSSGPVTFTDSRGTGTINNDDQNVNATINDVTLAEGNSGTTSFTFTVSLSAPAPAPRTLK
jgi:hypothetical protein